MWPGKISLPIKDKIFISLIMLFSPAPSPAGIDTGQRLDWVCAKSEQFEGNLRIIRLKSDVENGMAVYLLSA